MTKHRNSHNNELSHHLYAVTDKKDNDIVKYGISSDPIDKDGLSGRLRRQLRLFNAVVGWARFIGKILVKGIKGRKKVELMENEYIKAYKKEHGRKPRANRK